MNPEDLQLLIDNLNDSTPAAPSASISDVCASTLSQQALPCGPPRSFPPSSVQTSSLSTSSPPAPTCSSLPPPPIATSRPAAVCSSLVNEQAATSGPHQALTNPTSLSSPSTTSVSVHNQVNRPSGALTARRASLTVQTIDGGTSMITTAGTSPGGSQALPKPDQKGSKNTKVKFP